MDPQRPRPDPKNSAATAPSGIVMLSSSVPSTVGTASTVVTPLLYPTNCTSSYSMIDPRKRRSSYVNEVFESSPSGVQSLSDRSEEHTSELQSLMRISYAVLCLK